MSISSLGIGSGIDIGSLVNQLIKSEGEPTLKRLATKEAGFQAEISAFGSLKGALSSFKTSLTALNDISAFQKRSAISSDQSIFSASADSTAVAGQYGIEVVQLAEANKLVSKSGYFADSTATVGAGTLKITQDSTSFSIELTADDTLADLRDAINVATDNTGLTAAIINVDDGAGGTESKLVFTAQSTGVKNAITVEVDEDGDGVFNEAGAEDDTTGLSRLINVNVDQPVAAQDGQIKVDGQLVSSENNKFTSVIDGVTINAIDVAAAESLTIELDKNSVKSKINAFISSYNSLASTFASLASYDAETKSAGVLLGDSTMRAVESSLRNGVYSLSPNVSNAFSSLAEIGITTDEDGKLKLDNTKLDAVLESNFDDLGNLFTGDDGLASRLESVIANYVKSDGLIDSRTDGLKQRIDDITDQRERLEFRLTAVESRLIKQFSAMDALVNSLQSQSSFLTQQLTKLPGAFNRNNSN